MRAASFGLSFLAIATKVPIQVRLHLGVTIWKAHTTLLASLRHMRCRKSVHSLVSGALEDLNSLIEIERIEPNV